jgi:hypothetical protein
LLPDDKMTFCNLKEAMTMVAEFISRPKPQPLPPPFFSTSAKRQTVVGGRISLEPVNQLAARVIRPAHWLDKLLPEADKPYNQNERPKRRTQSVVQAIRVSKRKKSNRANKGNGTPIPRKQTEIRTLPENDAAETMGPLADQGETPSSGKTNSTPGVLNFQEAKWRLLHL